MKTTKFLSKIMALIYLFYEFGNGNLKVTTVLDNAGCWTGKVILEETTEEAKDDVEFANFYAKTFCEEKKQLGVDKIQPL